MIKVLGYAMLVYSPMVVVLGIWAGFWLGYLFSLSKKSLWLFGLVIILSTAFFSVLTYRSILVGLELTKGNTELGFNWFFVGLFFITLVASSKVVKR